MDDLECSQIESTQRLDISLENDNSFLQEEKQVASLEIGGVQHTIFSGNNFIGRDKKKCKIVLSNKSVSAHHAVIEIDAEDSHLLVDLGSSNRTRIGTLILKPNVRYSLYHNASVQFADLKGTYRILKYQAQDKPLLKSPDSFRTSSQVKDPISVDQSVLDQSIFENSSFVVPETPLQGKQLQDSIFIPPSQSLSDSSLHLHYDTDDSLQLKSPAETVGLNSTKKADIYDARTQMVCDEIRDDGIYHAETQAIIPTKSVSDSETDDEDIYDGLPDSEVKETVEDELKSSGTNDDHQSHSINILSMCPPETKANKNTNIEMDKDLKKIYEADTQCLTDIRNPTVEDADLFSDSYVEPETSTPKTCMEKKGSAMIHPSIKSVKSELSSTSKLISDKEEDECGGNVTKLLSKPGESSTSIYDVKTQLIPEEKVIHSDTDEKCGRNVTKSSSISKETVTGIYDAKTQLNLGNAGESETDEDELGGIETKEKRKSTDIYDAKTQLIPDGKCIESDTDDEECGSNVTKPLSKQEAGNIYEAKTQLNLGNAGESDTDDDGLVGIETEEAQKSTGIYDAKTQLISDGKGVESDTDDEECGNNVTNQLSKPEIKGTNIYDAKTQLNLGTADESETDDDELGCIGTKEKRKSTDIYDAKTQLISDGKGVESDTDDEECESNVTKPLSKQEAGNIYDAKTQLHLGNDDESETDDEELDGIKPKQEQTTSGIYDAKTQLVPGGVNVESETDDEECGINVTNPLSKPKETGNNIYDAKTQLNLGTADASETDDEELDIIKPKQEETASGIYDAKTQLIPGGPNAESETDDEECGSSVTKPLSKPEETGNNVYDAKTQLNLGTANESETDDELGGIEAKEKRKSTDIYDAKTQLIPDGKGVESDTDDEECESNVTKPLSKQEAGNIYDAKTQLHLGNDDESETDDEELGNIKSKQEQTASGIYDAKTQLIPGGVNVESETDDVECGINVTNPLSKPEETRNNIYDAKTQLNLGTTGENDPGGIKTKEKQKSTDIYDAKTQLVPGSTSAESETDDEEFGDNVTKPSPGPGKGSTSIYDAKTQLKAHEEDLKPETKSVDLGGTEVKEPESTESHAVKNCNANTTGKDESVVSKHRIKSKGDESQASSSKEIDVETLIDDTSCYSDEEKKRTVPSPVFIEDGSNDSVDKKNIESSSVGVEGSTTDGSETKNLISNDNLEVQEGGDPNTFSESGESPLSSTKMKAESINCSKSSDKTENKIPPPATIQKTSRRTLSLAKSKRSAGHVEESPSETENDNSGTLKTRKTQFHADAAGVHMAVQLNATEPVGLSESTVVKEAKKGLTSDQTESSTFDESDLSGKTAHSKDMIVINPEFSAKVGNDEEYADAEFVQGIRGKSCLRRSVAKRLQQLCDKEKIQSNEMNANTHKSDTSCTLKHEVSQQNQALIKIDSFQDVEVTQTQKKLRASSRKLTALSQGRVSASEASAPALSTVCKQKMNISARKLSLKLNSQTSPASVHKISPNMPHKTNASVVEVPIPNKPVDHISDEVNSRRQKSSSQALTTSNPIPKATLTSGKGKLRDTKLPVNFKNSLSPCHQEREHPSSPVVSTSGKTRQNSRSKRQLNSPKKNDLTSVLKSTRKDSSDIVKGNEEAPSKSDTSSSQSSVRRSQRNSQKLENVKEDAPVAATNIVVSSDIPKEAAASVSSLSLPQKSKEQSTDAPVVQKRVSGRKRKYQVESQSVDGVSATSESASSCSNMSDINEKRPTRSRKLTWKVRGGVEGLKSVFHRSYSPDVSEQFVKTEVLIDSSNQSSETSTSVDTLCNIPENQSRSRKKAKVDVEVTQEMQDSKLRKQTRGKGPLVSTQPGTSVSQTSTLAQSPRRTRNTLNDNSDPANVEVPSERDSHSPEIKSRAPKTRKHAKESQVSEKQCKDETDTISMGLPSRSSQRITSKRSADTTVQDSSMLKDVPKSQPRKRQVAGSAIEEESISLNSTRSGSVKRKGCASESFSADSEQKSKRQHTESSTLSPRSSPRQRGSTAKTESSVYNVLFTGYNNAQLESVVKNLGGTLVESTDTANVLVSDKVRRTVKFLCMVGHGHPVVSPEWLTMSKKARRFLDPWQYILADREYEIQHNFSLEKSLLLAVKNPILTNFSIYVTENVQPPVHEMKAIISSCGGKVLTRVPSVWPENSIVISCPKDQTKYAKMKGKVEVVGSEWLLSGVLKQHLQTALHKLN